MTSPATLESKLPEEELASGPHVEFTADAAFCARLKELSKLNVWRGLAAVAGDWLVIAACFGAALAWPSPIVWIVAAVIIASRQHALLIIMHDASHYRLLQNRRWNDRLSNWLLAWPLLVSTDGYRRNHLAHHRYLNTDQDPDWVRKEGKPEWEFPKTRRAIAGLLLRDLLGGGLLDQLRAIVSLSRTAPRNAGPAPSPIGRIVYYAALAAAVSLFQLWVPVLLLWFLPAFTLLPVILRIRSIAEHFGVEGENELNMSRNFGGPLWERLLLAPHHVGYHLDHHLHPSVPFYNLPQLHQALEHFPDYALLAHQNEALISSSASSRSVLHDVAGRCARAG